MTTTAHHIRDCTGGPPGSKQAVYRLSEPVEWSGWVRNTLEYVDHDNPRSTSYVFISAVPFAFDHGGSETLIFPAHAGTDEYGSILSSNEITGFRDCFDHAEAIGLAGWVMGEPETVIDAESSEAAGQLNP